MNVRVTLILTSLAVAFGMAGASPAAALTMKECSAKYKAAQQAGTLKGMKWNDFRKSECGASATPAAAPAPAPKTAAKPAPAAAKPMRATAAVFPSRVDPKYAKESAGRARLHTCRDQYNANKAHNGNGGLKWIQKGGGYWSECNKRLKS